MTDESPVTPAESVLPQDLIAQFTTDEAGIIREAIRDRGPEVWILWQVLMAQCEPMVGTNARFLLGWNGLRQLLGAVRMNEIAATLGAEVGP